MENKITSIEVIGSGCANCKKMHELVARVAKEMDIAVEVKYADDIQRVLSLGVMQFPVLIVNGNVVLAGMADLAKVKKVLSVPDDGGCGC